LCGNSLGLQPKEAQNIIEQELNDWAEFGVEGHFQAKRPWFAYHTFFTESLAKLVGANVKEVVAMNTLTVNLHLLMLSFYRPTKQRYKIIMEAGAFPSDMYAMETQAQLHGFDPEKAVIEIAPRKGEHTLRMEDIEATIEKHKKNLAIVVFGGVNYYTGQFFDIERITKLAHQAGALAGFDLAHAVGNKILRLHDWKVDFACWCSYKYLNSGPGAVGGIFVQEKHAKNPNTLKLAGWWGHDEKTRFKMKKGFKPMKTAESWQMSNAQVMNMAAHRASLNLFDQVGMEKLSAKSLLLTSFTAFLLNQLTNLKFEIITPVDPNERGCQLSLLFKSKGKEVFEKLQKNGVIADWREPNVIRIAPVPMYNSFEDVYTFYEIMKSV
jgi:kynureninase